MEDCKKYQKMIVPFDQGKLSLKDEELFVQHLESCADCTEELEIHYIISYGLVDDEDSILIEPEYKKYLSKYDFTGLVKAKLKNSHIKTEHNKKMNTDLAICWIVSNVLLLTATALFFIIKYF